MLSRAGGAARCETREFGADQCPGIHAPVDLLAAFRTFVRVAEAGSFSAVAREQGTTQPAISRQIAALEEHLGSRLIQRTTRSLTLTEDGRDLLDHAREVLQTVEEAEAAIGRRRSAPVGLVRIAVPTTFGRFYIIPRLPRLLDRYPDLSVEMVLADRTADLVAEGLDMAICGGAINDASLVSRRIASATRHVLVSAEHLETHGPIEHPTELATRACIIYSGAAEPHQWTFSGPEGPFTVHVDGRFRANSLEGVREATLAGLGFALIPSWYFPDEIASGQVRRVLRDWPMERVPIHAVYPSRRNLAPRVRAVIDFLVDEFRLDPVISSYGEA